MAVIKFRSKFQFQIRQQFYRTAEKVTEIKLVMVIVKQIPPPSQPSHFGYYFVFSWLRFKHTESKGSFT